jgi:hypothetical protein
VEFARVPSGTSALSKNSNAAVETRAPKMIARVLRGDSAAARPWDGPRRDARDEAEAETRAGEPRSTAPGFDFSRVRTYADGEADALAGDLGAAAFTPGRDISADNAARYEPHDLDGIAAPPIVGEILSSSGQPLDPETRAFFESRLAFDFSRVRIHNDHYAAESAYAVSAHAYTVANHVIFGAGRYVPGKPEGNRLLAHELTHVIQQETSKAPRVQRQPSGEDKENAERTKILTEFTVGAGLSEQQLARIRAAMRGFSLHQLGAMRKAGVRFWAPDSLPPEFSDRVQVKNVSTPAEYLDLLHIIRMTPGASTDAVRHEFAHAWDHVRTGKVKPIGKLNDKDFEKALMNTPELLSETSEKRVTKEVSGSKKRTVRLTISEMLEHYRKWRLREQSFDNPSTREGYSKTSPREFYAEGYSVFHSGNEWNEARLLYYAPELYELLEAEAEQEGLSVPDRSKIEAALKEQKLQ